MAFSKDFVWGAATASYQIEGGGLDYGRGECIWYRFSHTPGNVANGDTGDVACDHIHRYAEDIQLMQALGIDAYRFSISWPRILPEGTGAHNAQGLDFYDRLLDGLLAANITPYITLYHWDLPQALQDHGGWENPASLDWFAEYTDVVTKRYGDRVQHWTTFNEPFVVAMVGHLQGRHAPGKQDPAAAFTVAHHVLLAHARSMSIIRSNVAQAQAGIVLSQVHMMPHTNSEADRRATRRATAFHNDWYLGPLFWGTYPADLVAYLEPKGTFARINLDDIAQAQVPLDFLGVNYYTRNLITHQDDGLLDIGEAKNPDAEYTAMDWEVYPAGLLHQLLYLHNTYRPTSILITENGCAFPDPAPENGSVQDPRRVNYYTVHLDAVSQARELGVPVDGYFAWSLLDNFEWALGYEKRFGIYHVNFDTLERTPKASAHYYRDRIARERAK